MLDEIILHIGTPKTGTTALQLALSRQRRDLFRFGLFFPDASLLGERTQPVNLQDLTLYAANPDRPLALRNFRKEYQQQPAAYQAKIREEIAALVRQAADAQCDRLLLSAEGLYSRLESREEIKRLHDLLKPHTRSFRILVWFRRQDEYLLSRISQAAKLGTVTIDVASRLDGDYAYATRMKLWENVFPDAAFHVIPYQRDTLADFHRVMKLPDGLLLPLEGKINPSLSAEAIALLHFRELQSRSEEEARKTNRLRQIVRKIDPNRQGHRLALTPAARQRLMASFASENQALAQRYHGGVPFFDLSDLGPEEAWDSRPPYVAGESLIAALNLPPMDTTFLSEWLMAIVERFPGTTNAPPRKEQ